jgi:glycosyltransferase involved in cell wall biosynthesis
MIVMQAHNYYQQPGGEDGVFAAETALLESHGHQVLRYTAHNQAIASMSKLKSACGTIWNSESFSDVVNLLRRGRVDVLHCHNTFPLISPAIFHAARDVGVPVVQTLHNYRLLCPSANFLREGTICESCLGKAVPWPGVMHGCYRGSHVASATVAAMLSTHRLLGSWQGMVDVYVALSDFARRKFIQGGLPAERIVVKPNFLHVDPGVGPGRGGYAIFVGRLSPEKGLRTLIAAWERIGGRIPLKIVGDGPESPMVADAARRIPGVEWLGRQTMEEVYTLLGEASMLIFPSVWYETFGLVAIESFAKGTPVIAADIGAIAELVEHDRTGLLFRAGDAVDLARKAERAWGHPNKLATMGREARREFELKYDGARNYRMLIEIYEQAIRSSRSGASAR